MLLRRAVREHQPPLVLARCESVPRRRLATPGRPGHLLGQAGRLKGFSNFARPKSECLHADQLSIAELVGHEILRLDATLASGHLSRKQR